VIFFAVRFVATQNEKLPAQKTGIFADKNIFAIYPNHRKGFAPWVRHLPA
jgi:hypothetical protein